MVEAMRAEDFLEKVAGAGSAEDVVDLLQSAAGRFGLATLAIGAPHRNGDFAPFWHSTWPQDWLDLYAREGFAADDPAPRAAARLIAPITWSDMCEGRAGFALDAGARRVMDAGAASGFRNGLIVPIHGPGAYLAVASFAGPDRALSRVEMAALHMMAFYAHERLLALRQRPRRPDSPLTAREIEALEWVLAGLTDEGVAQKMRVSPRTARFHLDNARLKLGCRTRAQAAAAAMALGLLRP